MIPERIGDDYTYIINRIFLIIVVLIFLVFLFWDSVSSIMLKVFNLRLIIR